MSCRRILLVLFLIFLSYPALCQNLAKEKWDSAFYFYNRQELPKALHYIDEFIELHPVASQGYLAKGQFLGSLGRFQQSNEVLTSLLARDPNVNGVYQLRGLNYLFLEQYDSSVNDLTRVLALRSEDDSLAYRARAYSYYKLGKYDKSKIDYDSADRFKPNDPDYFHNRSMNKYAMGDLAGAIQDLSHALRIKPHFFDAVRSRATLYFEAKDIVKCMADCNTILNRDKNDQVMLFLRGQCHMAQKEHRLAVIDFNACSEQDPSMKELWLLRGAANYYLAQDEKAIADLTKALQFSDKKPMIYQLLGICKNNLKPGTGCADLQRAIELGNKDAMRTLKGECK